jgi:lysophospholipase L1-like esterase
MKNYHNYKIIAFGDSTTAPRDGITVYSKIIESQCLESRIDAVVLNAGVPSNTTNDAQKRFEHDVLAFNPDITIIQLGINDAAVDVWKDPPESKSRVSLEDYEKNLVSFIASLKSICSEVILMTPNPLCWTPQLIEMYGKEPYDPNDSDGFNLILKIYVAKMHDVAMREGVLCVDIYKAYQQAELPLSQLLIDGIHPSTVGHELVARSLWPSLYACLNNCKSKVK